jgi:CBS-domain-containing membrane protein
MSPPAVTARAEAARLMAGHRIERLPVVDEENRLIGVVTLTGHSAGAHPPRHRRGVRGPVW